MNKKKNILITGGGAPGAYGIIKALRSNNDLRIVAGDMRLDCIGKLVADDFVQLPPANDAQFVNTLLEICIEKKIQLVFPLVTKELPHLAKYKKTFSEKGITVLVNDYELISEVNDKGLLYEKLATSEVSTPEFSVCRNTSDFEKALNSFHSEKKCIKPCVSNGQRGFRVLGSGLLDFGDWLHKKPQASPISFEEVLHLLSHELCPPVLLSEYLPGQEYTIDILRLNNKIKYILPRKRTKMIGGISVEGELVDDREIIQYCKEVLEIFPLEGLFGIQVKLDINGHPKILEINPRVQGTTVACMGAGVNLPLMLIEHHLFPEKVIDFTTPKWGTKFIRHWEEKFFHD